jgi:hypothetical protein
VRGSRMVESWTNEQIISDVLGRGADIQLGGGERLAAFALAPVRRQL